MEASGNLIKLFIEVLQAVNIYGVPSRIRFDLQQ